MIQGSPEWFEARCGNVTASEFGSVLAKGQGKTRAAYLHRIVSERITHKPAETFSGAHTRRGQEQEPRARMAYEARCGYLVEEVGFIKHREIKAGCSPDGLVDADGGSEFKSVIPTVQVETILAGGYPSEHKPQVQGNLWIAERSWWDFVSFCPDLVDERLRLYVFRVQRDEAYIRTLEAEVRKFDAEADRLVDFLLGRDNLEEQLRASLAKIGQAA